MSGYLALPKNDYLCPMSQAIPTTSQADHLKGILHLSKDMPWVTTNALAAYVQSKPASVTGMVKLLEHQGWVTHRAYRGVALTEDGRRWALGLVRSHRLWEVFLSDCLGFAWHEVHDMAEQLEHIGQGELIERLDRFLGHPQWDPHGDPIPNTHGVLPVRPRVLSIDDLAQNVWAEVVGMHEVKDAFLMHLDALGVFCGLRLKVLRLFEFDRSFEVEYLDGKRFIWTMETAGNLMFELVSTNHE